MPETVQTAQATKEEQATQAAQETKETQAAQQEVSFAFRLKQALANKHMRQTDLINCAATRGIKLGKSQISQYVSGKTIPRADVLNVLADILEVAPQWLSPSNTPITSKACEAQTFSTASKVSSNNAATTSANSDIQHAANTTKQNASQVEGKHPMTTREIKKSTKLDNVLYDIRGPVSDEAARMEKDGTRILKLNIGNPAPFGFRTPDEVIYDMRQQLTECEGYSDSKGLFSARKAIMQYAQIKHIPNVAIDDIYTGNGVSELINISLSALLDNGDEVLVPSPDYPLWTACVTLAGGVAVHYQCDEQSEWYPDIADIEKHITSRTKAIVLINPNNPTGALYPKEVLQEIVEVARKHQLIIFSDEIYDRLVMDGLEHVSTASLAPDLFCVTFSGLSKSHMIPGYRIGWMILSGDKSRAKDYILGLNMLCNMRMCSNVPGQSVVQTALGGHQSVNDYLVPGGRVFEQREFVYNALCDIPGISVVKPKAAFYIFPKLDTKKFNIIDDEKFALDLLREKKILIVQGTGFNWKKPDHFRIVYLPRVEVLSDAMTKITDFLAHYHQ